MHIFLRHLITSSMAVVLFAALPAFAESAPVYDVDSGFDNTAMDQGQDLPPPPPPAQEGAFIPGSQQDNMPPSFPQAPVERQRQQPPQQRLSMDQRLQRMERQIDNLQNGDSSARLNSLQDQVQSLRGQLEQLSHQLQQMQSQQKSMYSDLDKRLILQKQQQMANLNKKADTSGNENASNLTALEPAKEQAKPLAHKKSAAKLASAKPMAEHAKPSAEHAPDTVLKSSQDQPNVAEEQEIYQTAYNMIKTKKYNEAVNALQGMLKKYPSGQFASNAHYWLGELYGLMKKNDQALNEFDTVVKTFPDSPRVSDAQLKVGLILASQSKWTDAKAAFKKVINHYPGTASARLAAENLTQINQAGH